MIAVDTNVVVRLLIRDDVAQARVAESLFSGSHIAVPHTVLVETEWVLRRSYGFLREQIAAGLVKLLGMETVTCSDSQAVRHAIDAFADGWDFADAMHAATSRAASEMVTFDTSFARRARSARGMPPVRLLEGS